MKFDSKIDNIFELIEFVKKRPGMYLGDTSITSMNTFLDGYNFACFVNNIDNHDVYPLFWYFHEWAKEKYNWYESSAGWKNIILKENQNDEIKSLAVFFELIEEFKNLTPLSIEYIELNEDNLKFHHSELCKTKSYDPKSSILNLPVYENADKVFLIEHSHNFGFSVFITYQNILLGYDWRKRFKTPKKAKLFAKSLFDVDEKWKPLTGNLTEKINEIIKVRLT